MATCISNYLAAKILNSVVHQKLFTLEATWIALHTSDPGPTADLSTEVVGGSYSRQHALAAKWATPSNATVAYKAALRFLNMPSCTVTHVGLWTLGSGGNMTIWGALSTPVVVVSGGSFIISASDLAIVLSS